MLAPNQATWTDLDIELVERLAHDDARKCFWAYRRYMNPNMIEGWWQLRVARELLQFWEDYLAGKRPRLLLQSPPQHGKSTMAIDFLAWAVGQSFLLKRKDIRVIFASFSDRLGVRANLALQRIFRHPRYIALFGNVLAPDGICNSELIEFASARFVGTNNFFRNTTVQGPVNGEGLELGVIDDPIKSRAEASSQLTRDKTWSWMTDDFMPRFADHAGLLLIMTRWHIDDPAGRLMQIDPTVRVVRYPAIAEHDEEHRKEGDPLFPELKSLEFLRRQRKVMTLAGWESVYQQSPIIVGGDMFPIEKVEVLPERPARADVRYAIRYWDKAGTQDGGAYSAGVLMLKMKDDTFVVADVRRGQWSALNRERIMKQTAEIDKQLYGIVKIFIEQEPGSGGKESAEASIKMLAGFTVEADKVTGNKGQANGKVVRADPFAAQWQAGNVRMVVGDWNREYLDEHEHFPAGKFKDQVDASSGAFNKIASKYRYDGSLRWVS